MDARIHFGKIYIIEWLAPGDRKTGWDLSEAISGVAEAHWPPVRVAFKRVKTRDEFVGYIRSVRDDFRETRLLPLLHVETHGITLDRPGGPHGIGSSVDDCVLWPELMQELIPLNELTQLRLFVTLAACEGIWAMQMLQPTERTARS